MLFNGVIPFTVKGLWVNAEGVHINVRHLNFGGFPQTSPFLVKMGLWGLRYEAHSFTRIHGLQNASDGKKVYFIFEQSLSVRTLFQWT